jgi:hypothetical protein
MARKLDWELKMAKYVVMADSANGTAHEAIICAPQKAYNLEAARQACRAEIRAGRNAYIVDQLGNGQTPGGRHRRPMAPLTPYTLTRIAMLCAEGE